MVKVFIPATTTQLLIMLCIEVLAQRQWLFDCPCGQFLSSNDHHITRHKRHTKTRLYSYKSFIKAFWYVLIGTKLKILALPSRKKIIYQQMSSLDDGIDIIAHYTVCTLRAWWRAYIFSYYSSHCNNIESRQHLLQYCKQML